MGHRRWGQAEGWSPRDCVQIRESLKVPRSFQPSQQHKRAGGPEAIGCPGAGWGSREGLLGSPSPPGAQPSGNRVHTTPTLTQASNTTEDKVTECVCGGGGVRARAHVWRAHLRVSGSSEEEDLQFSWMWFDWLSRSSGLFPILLGEQPGLN